MNGLLDDMREILLTEAQIQDKVKQLGAEISRRYDGQNPLAVCVLKGAFIFMADLVKNIAIPIEIDFMAVSSYGPSTKSSGVVRIVKDLDVPVEHRNVIIVEDIVDTGLTLNYLTDVLRRRNAASVSVVTLLDKPERRTAAVRPDLAGFVIPDAFVVGYGLDYAEKYRNLPFIGILDNEIHAQ